MNGFWVIKRVLQAKGLPVDGGPFYFAEIFACRCFFISLVHSLIPGPRHNSANKIRLCGSISISVVLKVLMQPSFKHRIFGSGFGMSYQVITKMRQYIGVHWQRTNCVRRSQRLRRSHRLHRSYRTLPARHMFFCPSDQSG